MRNEHIFLQKMGMFLAALFIVPKKMETTQKYINITIGEYTVVYFSNGILHSNEKE